MNRIVCAVCSAWLLLGCTSNPAPGELVVLLSSDMQMPDSFDAVILTVGNVEHVYRDNPLGSSVSTDPACSYKAKPHDRRLELPATVSIISDQQNESALNGVQLIACKEGRLVFSERFDAKLPKAGEVQMIRAPIRWLCTNRTDDCYGCRPSPCHHRSITPTDATQCVPDTCRNHTLEVYENVDVDEPEVNSHATGKEIGTCFDVAQCFAMDEMDLADSQVAVGWQGDPDETGSGQKPLCLGALQPGPERRDRVNLALVVPRDSRGYCNDAHCLVPLDADMKPPDDRLGGDAVGWFWLSPESNLIELPRAVCHMLDSGQILYVARSESCSSKSFRVPACTKSSDKQPSDADADGYQRFVNMAKLYLSFDDLGDSPSPTIVAENRSEPFDVLPLPSASTSSLQFVSNAGVRGTKAGRFNNHQYAKSQNAIDLKGDFSASAWVSTEDFESSLEPRMPILSNLSADCASGVRLELRVCDDDPTTIVAAMGRPAGKQNDGQCKLDFEYAPLTQRSFVGGYFTPWHSGNWYHLMATSEGGVARLYVDGARADLSRVARECPSVIRNTRNVQSSDDSQLYIGWHADGLSKSADMEPPVSRSILIDEVMLFQQALSEVEITRLELASKSEPGPSGLRWGPWGTQGGFVTRAPEASGLTYTVHDEEFSSAGVFAVLGQPKDILNVTGPAKLPDLSDFDEAVLVTTGWSPNVPFQFALSSDHGLRQCTWQLEGHEPISTRPASGSLEPQRDMFVINLRRPSWCISPDLVLDTRRIELVSIGSDWKLPHSSYNFDVDALAFRKRHFASSTDDPAPVLGGVIGPNGWYWKAVSYDPGWEPQPPKQLAKVDGNTPVTMPKALYSGTEAPELAADLPDNQGSRDFSGCKTMQICMTANDPAPPFREPMFVMQNEIGQTWSVQLSPSSGCPLIAELDRGYAWPSKNPPSLNDVRSAVTRISIRYSGNAQVDYVKCCDADGLCVDIEKLPVH